MAKFGFDEAKFLAEILAKVNDHHDESKPEVKHDIPALANQAAPAAGPGFLEQLFSNPLIAAAIQAAIMGYIAKLLAPKPTQPGVPTAPALPPSAPPVALPPNPAPAEALLYPDGGFVNISHNPDDGGITARDGEAVPFERGDDGQLRPLATSNFDDGVIVRLEPMWTNGSGPNNGVLIAEANDDSGPNPHLRWKQRVVIDSVGPDGSHSRVVEGGTGKPDPEQNDDDRAFVRLKRYNETRGQVIPVRLAGKNTSYTLAVEMDTPSGVLRLAPVSLHVGN